ncbi:MAG: helix-turn-helix transcriptional regulator [Candidatus Gastranaerophilaceae bacterium]|jgi:transcriptional regulator with XRE-family HTH domain
MYTQGFRLKKIRQELNITQQDLADKLGITKANVSKVENDNGSFSSEILNKLLVDLNLNINYLLAGIGEPFLTKEHLSKDDELYTKFKEFMKQEGL